MRVSTSRRQRDTLLKETQKRPLRTGTSHVREQETKDFSQPECLRADRRATNREGRPLPRRRARGTHVPGVNTETSGDRLRPPAEREGGKDTGKPQGGAGRGATGPSRAQGRRPAGAGASSTHLHQLQLPAVPAAGLRVHRLQEHDAHLVALGRQARAPSGLPCPGRAAHLPGRPATARSATCSTTSGLLSVGRNTSPRWVSECSS